MKVAILAFVVFLLILVALAMPVRAEADVDPVAFCAGFEGWQMDLRGVDEDPPDPQCGPGDFMVDVNTVLEGPFDFKGALNNIRSRGGFGTLWFQPAPVTPEPTPEPTEEPTTEPTEEPTPEPQPVSAPEGFCSGSVGWPVNLATDIPQEPACGAGDYLVEVAGQLREPLPDFGAAGANLAARGNVGTLWFEPEEVMPPLRLETFLPAIQVAKEDSLAPADFCDGTVGWLLDLASQDPINPGCKNSHGKFLITVGDTAEKIRGFEAAVENLRSLGGVGTFWFVE